MVKIKVEDFREMVSSSKITNTKQQLVISEILEKIKDYKDGWIVRIESPLQLATLAKTCSIVEPIFKIGERHYIYLQKEGVSKKW